MIGRDTLAFRTLLEVAHQRPGIDEQRCRLVLEFLRTAAALQSSLRQELEALELTEIKFAVLIVLFPLAPSPLTPADLAVHTGATRSAMTDALAQLESRAWIARVRDPGDRRSVFVHLTKAGAEIAEAGLVRFLTRLSQAARYVTPEEQRHLLASCAQLNEGAERLAPAR